MFDSIDNILRNILEPISGTGRNIILVVAVALLIFAVVRLLFAIQKTDFKKALVWLLVAILLVVIGSKGYGITKDLGEQQGEDFEKGLSALMPIALIPSYMAFKRYEKKQKNN
ncbi:hypothetical protein [Staphylococcus chromogenes]|uniref:hypothetical protein n=1 Tax=Staphylococcus chromogenes TaxID=46126 RepID=UPI00188F1774|nr:hypothetical protein [Staphylococcus chromogenes]HDF3152076.1 hypothetical protein [Staphylococcus aureus]